MGIPKRMEFLQVMRTEVYALLNDFGKFKKVYIEVTQDFEDEYYKISWESEIFEREEYHLSIKVSDVGPARHWDFMENIKKELQMNYPELLL